MLVLVSTVGSPKPVRFSPARIRRPLRACLLALMIAVAGFGAGPAQPAAASAQSGAVALDAWGGLHAFGGLNLNTSGSPYWPGWYIARAVAVRADGSGGWTLDAWGGIHNWGSAQPIQTPFYMPGWDIAQGLVVLPDNRSGYVVDGWGGLHAFGSAPGLPGAPWWFGWNIIRGMDVHFNGNGTPDGGWTLDAWGGTHSFGAAPVLSTSHYYAGWDIFRGLHVVAGGAYEVAHFGMIESLGSPNGIDWSNMPSWGAWDIVSDVAFVNPRLASNGTPNIRTQVNAVMAELQSIDRLQRGRWWLGANAALDQVAGNGASYNLASCGGPWAAISDRTADMYSRNYFAHPIAGCSGTRYVFSTYMWWGWSFAGENIAWTGGISDSLDAVWKINNMWLTSPAHYANLMSGNFNRVGCGGYYDPSGAYQGYRGPVWVWACEFNG